LFKLEKVYLHNNLFVEPFLNLHVEKSVDFVSFKKATNEKTVENDICYLVVCFDLITMISLV
jgi:hypothetical protein